MMSDPVTASSIEAVAKFIEVEAAAFTETRFDDLLALLDTPTSVYVFTSMLMISDLDTAKSLLGVFHGNLRKANFAKTQTEILGIIEETEDKGQVKTQTTFLTSEGEALLRIDVIYFCVLSASRQSWRVRMLEVANEPNGQFIKGIDLL